LWSAWFSTDELLAKHGLEMETLDRWAATGYVQWMLRKPDGHTETRCARIRGFLGANPGDELRAVEASSRHAEKCGLVAGRKA
jgi:hypothetical protein